MKKIFYSIMTLSLLLCACDKDEQGQSSDIILNSDIIFNSIQPPIKGMMIDAACITKMQMYCMEYNKNKLADASILYSQYYYSYVTTNKEPVFFDYKNVGIYVAFHRSGNGLETDSTQTSKDISKQVWDYYKNKTAVLVEQLDKLDKPMGWPLFFTSYVNGDVQLTCDKVLFGKQPGEDISRHFSVSPYCNCLPIGREQPEMLYSFDDETQLEAGISMASLFKKDTWMQSSYLIGFKDEPTERYDEITFTLTFPASLEHVREFVTSKYKGENAPMRVTDTTFTASFMAKFNWE